MEQASILFWKKYFVTKKENIYKTWRIDGKKNKKNATFFNEKNIKFK